LTAPYRADEPLLHEQALVGLSIGGSAAAVQLIDAEGAPPQLELLALDAAGGATRHAGSAPQDAALAVARRLRADGQKPVPLLASAVAQEWPEGLALAVQQGFAASAPIAHDLLGGLRVSGAPESGSLPLLLRIVLADGDPRAFTMVLSAAPGVDAGGGEVELARQPISGRPIEPAVWIAAGVAWLLSGSVADGEPLRRAVGLRRGSLRRGEAELHNAHGISLRAARDWTGAGREFERASATDPQFFDAVYNAASTAALSGRDDAAVALLRRAAQLDRRRLQVLGRNDEWPEPLRSRADVREILGMKRSPPASSK